MPRWVTPTDPDCPILSDVLESLWNDPMTAECGVGDEIAAEIERQHALVCERCQEYCAANIDVVY